MIDEEISCVFDSQFSVVAAQTVAVFARQKLYPPQQKHTKKMKLDTRTAIIASGQIYFWPDTHLFM